MKKYKKIKAYNEALTTTETLAGIIKYACTRDANRRPLDFEDILKAVSDNGRAYRNYYNITGRDFATDFCFSRQTKGGGSW